MKLTFKVTTHRGGRVTTKTFPDALSKDRYIKALDEAAELEPARGHSAPKIEMLLQEDHNG